MKRLLAFLLALLLCVPAALAESSVRWINGGNADRVHLRAEPSAKADSLGLYFTGTSGIVIDQADDWAWVMIGDVTGYVMADYLTGNPPAQLGPWYIVDNPSSTWVNLRMAPSEDGLIALCPDNGTAVHILGETADGWSYVECQGVKGYMKTQLLSPMENAYMVQRTTILSDPGWDEYIHQYIAPNGQTLYFNARLREPIIEFVDVNFDGRDDIVITTGRWAKCDTVMFYVYDPAEGYVLVPETCCDEGLMNYALYPEYGLVGTSISNGSAGAEHEKRLYRWEGNDLTCIRRADSETYTETVWHEKSYTKTTYTDRFCCNVYDYTTGVPEGEVIYSVGPLELNEFFETIDAEDAALWQGLR